MKAIPPRFQCSIPFSPSGKPKRTAIVALIALLLGALPTLADEEPGFNPEIELPTASSAATTTAETSPYQPIEFDWEQGTVAQRVDRLMAIMTIEEKIGQLCQISTSGDTLSPEVQTLIREGKIGSLFYAGGAERTREAQRIACTESRLGIPLLTPRDVIHGFRTVFPIPLGQAATWNPELVEQAAAVAAREARASGINWTFAPMLDVARDSRWGRIAESVGEDPVLAARLAQAMVRGYQNPGPNGEPGIAACAKHFAAYGLSEGGRDYNRVQVAQSELHNVLLPPFKAAVDAGCMTFMTGFSSVNGIPATGHEELVRGVLKGDWGFGGLVVSDWASIVEMIEHGYAKDNKQAAYRAMAAGVDMEMATTTYVDHLKELIDEGQIELSILNDAVERVLTIKMRVTLSDRQEILAGTPPVGTSEPAPESLALARQIARQSFVLLKNKGVLPLDAAQLDRVALIGPLADAARDQLGCWMLDGKREETITPLVALREALADKAEVTMVAGLASSVDTEEAQFDKAVTAAKEADVVILVVGEEWWLSGEARCRADINLPGAQEELIQRVTETGTPVVLVCFAGRPLTMGPQIEQSAAVLYGWHPGTMGGPALADLLLGVESPSGKLPVTFPKHVGQAPLYYNHPNTGRPALQGTEALIGSGRSDFPQDQKFRSHYIDVDPFPLYPFGYGLSYTTFAYEPIELSTKRIAIGQTLAIRVKITNTGDTAAEEVAQLYVRDVTASLVRPVRELKDFRRVRLDPGESQILEFALRSDQLSYYDNRPELVSESGEFQVGVGGDSTAPLTESFWLGQPAVAKQVKKGQPASP